MPLRSDIPRHPGRSAAILVAAFALLIPARARAQIAVVGNTVEEHSAGPGESYTGTILIRNLSKVAQPARIYQTDYTFNADGTSDFAAPSSLPRSNARWITLSTTSVVVPPLGDVPVAYSVTVPKGDSLRGTYWSAIMIEGAREEAPQVKAQQVGLGVVVRYAVQVATQLTAAGARRITFARQQVVADKDSSRVLQLSVENIGERAYRPLLWVELYDGAGTMVKTEKQQRGLLYPGTSLLQRFDFGRLPAGAYKAIVFADIGNDDVIAAQYKLQF